MLRLITERPAQSLRPLVQSLFDQEKLTLRQFRIWQLKNFTAKSLFAITQTLGAEGFTGHGGRPVQIATVKADLARARKIIDLAALEIEEEENGEINFSIAIAHGPRLGLTPDVTALQAHRNLGVGIRQWESQEGLKRAA